MQSMGAGVERFGGRRPLLTAAVASLLLLVLAAPHARAQGEQASLAEVIEAVGIEDIAADYVVLVDVSGSMQGSGLYDQVRAALQPWLGALQPQDNLSLITFGAGRTLVFAGPIGDDPARVLANLPPEAREPSTDIGAAISRGLGELERPDAAEIGTLVLLTDGLHEPPASTDYPGTTGRAWDQLMERGQALAADGLVSAYAVALTPETDAGLLQQVFADALVIAVPGDQVSPFLERVRDETQRAKLRGEMVADVDAQVVSASLSPDGVQGMDLLEGTGKTSLTLASGTTYVPLVVENLVSSVEGLAIEVGGLPERVELAPGESVTIPVDVSFPPAGGFAFGREQVTQSGSLTIEGSVSTPWHTVLSDDLGLEFSPSVQPASAETSASGEVGWSWGRLAWIAAGILALLMLLWALYMSRQPKMRGQLTIYDDGEQVLERNIGGRKLKLGKGRFQVPGGGLRGTVRGVERRDDYDGSPEWGVKVSAKAGKASKTSTLFPGNSMTVGNFAIDYNQN